MQSTPECEWIEYIKIHENGEIQFLCSIYKMVVYKFDFDVSNHTDQGWKSRERKKRSTPSMLFPKHRMFHLSLMFHFDPDPISPSS